jgi:hypothetical protein
MLHEDMTRQQIDELLQKYNGDETKLNNLMNLELDCNFSTAYELDRVFGLEERGGFYENWGGQGNLWVWSTTYKAWLFVDSDSHLRLWDRKGSSPSQGQSFGRIEPYYRENMEKFVNLLEFRD